jgi:thioester reductase-like protein
MSGAVLLSGVTGFLGMETLARLLERPQTEVIVIVRADDGEDARRRLAETMAALDVAAPAPGARVRAVRGDLLEPGLGLSREDRRMIVSSVDRIVHCAASISFELPLGEARAINVGGVARMIDLAREIHARGSLRRLLHVSTAYVSGRHSGCFHEHDLDLGQEFRNTYERSKAEAEHLLGEARELPTVIARPSIVVGHRLSGWTPAFNVIYWPIRAAERGLLTEAPARAESIVDFVPVDYVAEGMLALLDDPAASGAYHLVAGERALTAGELVELHAALLGRPPVRLTGSGGDAGLPSGAEAFLPYFDVRCTFDESRVDAILARTGIDRPDPSEYFPRLIDFAHATRWGKRQTSRRAALDRVSSFSGLARVPAA